MHRQQTTSVSGRFPCLLGMGPKIMVPENQQQIWKHSTVAFTPACPQFPDVTPDSCSGYCSSSLKKGKDVTGVWFPRPLSWNHPPPAHHQVLSEHLLVCVPSQRPIPPSTVIPTVILRFILCHFSSRTFLSYNQPCSTQTDFSLIQDLSKNHSLAKKKKVKLPLLLFLFKRQDRGSRNAWHLPKSSWLPSCWLCLRAPCSSDERLHIHVATEKSQMQLLRTLILLREWASQPFITASASPFYSIFNPLKHSTQMAREEMYQKGH